MTPPFGNTTYRRDIADWGNVIPPLINQRDYANYSPMEEVARLRAILDMVKTYPYLPSNLAKKIEEMEKQQ